MYQISDLDSSGMILCAYYRDQSVDRWQIVLPIEINDSIMVVEPSFFHRFWSWGLVSLYEVDSELYLRPLMEDLFGEEVWSDALTEIETIIDTIPIANNFNCELFSLARTSCESLYRILEDDMAQFLYAGSPYFGDCYILLENPAEALEQIFEYLKIQMQANFIGAMGPNILGGIVAKLYEKLLLAEKGITCDYATFFYASIGGWPQFWVYYILRIFCYALIHFIDWTVMDSGVINCPTWTPSEIDWFN